MALGFGDYVYVHRHGMDQYVQKGDIIASSHLANPVHGYDVADLSGEIDSLSVALSGEIDTLSAKLSGEIDSLSIALSGEINSLSVYAALRSD